jgi:hypothetical protein
MENINSNLFEPKFNQELVKHFDADTGFYFKEQLTSQLPETFNTIYAGLNGPKLVPIRSTIAETYRYGTYNIMDSFGQPKWDVDTSTDTPAAEVNAKRKEYRIFRKSLKMIFTSDDITLSSRLPSIIDDKRLSVLQGHAQDTNKIIFLGDYQKKLLDNDFYGWINHPDITKTEVAAGTGGKTWAQKTGLEIVKDLSDAVAEMQRSTNGSHVVDTIALPILQYQKLITTIIGSGIDTAFEYFQKVCPGVTLIPANELEKAYPGNKDMFIAYQKAGNNFWFESSELKFTNIFQSKEDMFEVHAKLWHGGIILPRPKSQLIRYGI